MPPAGASGLAARLHPSLVGGIRQFAGRLAAVRVVESALILAAQAFLALFPLLIVAYGLFPKAAATGLLTTMQHRLGLSGESLETIQTLFSHRDQAQRSLSAVSILIILGSATAFTRRLQAMYERTWDLPRLGARGVWRSVAWIVGMLCYFGVTGWFVHLIDDRAASAPVSAVLGFFFWWWTGFLLLGGRVTARALVPAAALTCIVQYAATLISVVVLPRSIRSNEKTYGPLGVVFALQSWLVVLGGAIAICAAAGAAAGRIDTPFGARVRGSVDPDGWRRCPHRQRTARLGGDRSRATPPPQS